EDGREYFFVSSETFDHYVATDAFLEWALVHEQRYGTLRSQVDALAIATGAIFKDGI
ncbi:hypothetical protein C2W62_53825, partial [Candidatus Entotheonella serta]